MIKGSPFEQPVPLMLFANKEPSSFLFARLNPSETYLTSLPKVEKVFNDVLPAHPFNYEFTDASYARKFRDEERISSLASLFSVLAIVISCLGLFGLSAFVVEQRTKEIGIRKILGANPAMLWLMLSKGFTLLVIAASILAIPVAIYLIDWWLADYNYRIPIPYGLFGLSCIGGLLIALLTISYHTLKAAVSNPVLSLRSE
jgi:ABC-type antimicrobial peptide transport system permease subunit